MISPIFPGSIFVPIRRYILVVDHLDNICSHPPAAHKPNSTPPSGDAVEVLLYIRQIQMRLGVKAACDMVSYVETPPDAVPEDFYQGYLFPEFVGQLEESFSVPFARPSIVQIMVPIDPSMI